MARSPQQRTLEDFEWVVLKASSKVRRVQVFPERRTPTMIAIQVFSQSNGRPKKGVRVTIMYPGTFTHSDCGYTDSNGYAYANVGSASGEVWIEGRRVYAGYLQGTLRVHA